jgi:1-acyl-sn-glycerol-3-phosphate acyltransferase
LQSGGVVGIFAEGGLERPPEHINPYLPGVGLLILKGKARVLPVVISGTPKVDEAYASLFIPSRSRVRFLPVRDFTGAGLSAAEIATSLEEEAAHAQGWRQTPQAEKPGRKK